MIELSVQLSEIDYEALLRKLGGSAGNFAGLAGSLPNAVKEDLAVKTINAGAAAFSEKVEKLGESNGVHLKVDNIRAKKL